MKPNIPKYRDPEKKLFYKADSCSELREAWSNKELELTVLARGTYPGKALAEGELTRVKSIGFWDIKKLQKWGLDWHTNEGIEICFLESGNLQFLMKEGKFRLQPNDITITRPWIEHKLGDPVVDLSKLYWLILDVNIRYPHQKWLWPDWILLSHTDLLELTRYLRQNEQPVWKASSEIRECFVNIGKVVTMCDRKPYESHLKILINTLLVLLLELFQKGSIPLDNSLVKSKRTVELFLKTMELNIADRWTVEKMAGYCLMGSTRFTYYCNEIINCSPMEYLNLLRLNEAAKLLVMEPDTTIAEIAYRSGFSSPQYFNFAFNRHYKTAPGNYRNHQLQLNKDFVSQEQE